MSLSTSPFFWLDSGGSLYLTKGVGTTIQGPLSEKSPWRITYQRQNALDTDDGYRPQNILRLVTKGKWRNAREEAYFIINADNLTVSPNRNSSNGLFFFNRYQDSNNLYYAGIRVDGAAVIKKKQKGIYYNIAYIPGIYSGIYNPVTYPNLLPKNKWIGLRSEVTDLSDGSVFIQLFIDKGWSGSWKLVAEGIDRGADGPPIIAAGHGGIRTDFMDVTFENFRITTL